MRKMTMVLTVVLALCLAGNAAAEIGANPGKSFEVDIGVTSLDAAFTALEYTYDQDAFQYEETTIDENYFSGATDGRITIASLGNLVSGIVGKLKFKVKETAKLGKYTIDFVPVETVSRDEEDTILIADDQDVVVETLINSFVRRCYSIVLGRNPDDAGLADWSSQLEAGKTTAAQIVSGFMNSPEFLEKENSSEDTVEVLYNTMLNRESDAAGKQDWVEYLDSGCSSNSVINGFCGSQEFMGLCDEYGIKAGSAEEEQRDKNKNLTAFVNRCYIQALNREGEPGGLNSWCETLRTGKQTPKQVASGFVFSEELAKRKLSNEELVDMLYRLYLGREADPAGRADWVEKMNNGMTLEKLNDGFADSPEFREIVNSYGLGK